MKIFKYLFPFCLFGFLNIAKAGIVIQIDDTIPVEHVQEIEILESKDLRILIDGKSYRINLPEDALPFLVQWVAADLKGPFVFSIDGSLGGYGKKFFPGGIPKPLAMAILNYDVYAHNLACGRLPEGIDKHPFRKGKSNYSRFPYQQALELSKLKNKSPEAVWYRRLCQRYTRPPVAIGELTLIASPSPKGFPLKLSISSFLGFIPEKWHTNYDADSLRKGFSGEVPSEWDQYAMNLPYFPLQSHLEQHWDQYRKVFPTMDELSSIVEAYAILRAIYMTKPGLWKSLLNEMRPANPRAIIYDYEVRFRHPKESVDALRDLFKNWNALVFKQIGDSVETLAEAEMVLSIIMELNRSDNSISKLFSLYKGVLNMDSIPPSLYAKIILIGVIKGLRDSAEELRKSAKRFFAETKQDFQLFRLRVFGYQEINLVHQILGKRDSLLDSLLTVEKNAIIRDFCHQFNVSLESPEQDFILWEDLARAVYFTDLPKLEKSLNNGRFSKTFSQIVARIHYQRGKAFQKGRNLGYSHVHYRYLGYLTDHAPSDFYLWLEFFCYKNELGELMGIHYK